MNDISRDSMKKLKIAILALQGNVIEHFNALKNATKKADICIDIIMARDLTDLEDIDAIILPGGESTAISLLIQRSQMLEKIKKIPAVFGTCAGLILMSKDVLGLEKWQKTLELMDVNVCRNAYGTQTDSFSSQLDWDYMNNEEILFIRAPKILDVKNNVKILARDKKTNDIAIVEQYDSQTGQYFLGATCHPEMSNSKLTEYFLKKILLHTKI